MPATQQQRDNLAQACSIIDSIPGNVMDLRAYLTQQAPVLHSESFRSLLGWLAQHPYFAAQGLQLHDDGLALQPVIRQENGKYIFSHAVASILFGTLQKEVVPGVCLFAKRGAGDFDAELLKGRAKLSDKQLALARLRRFAEEIAAEDAVVAAE